MTLNLLKFEFNDKDRIPLGYDFPMVSFLINTFIERDYKVIAYTTSTGISNPIVFDSPNLTICIGRRREKGSARDLFKHERKDLMKLMQTYSSDIINAQWSYEFAWAAIDTGIPTVVTLHDHAMTIFRYQTDSYRFMRLIMNYIVLKKAKYLSVNSKYLYDKLDTQKKRKARIIPNFYSRFIESLYYNQAEKSKYILSVSNGFGKMKNIDTALKAFALVRNQYLDIEYHLIGDDMEPLGAAYQFAKKNNIISGIKFLGKLPFNEVIKKIEKARIFLHPSREESFGMAVLEAMVIGTPVIGGAKSGNIPYLLDNGKAGELCNVNSPEDIGRSILKILQDEDYAENLMRDAYIYAKKKYSENIIISKYIDYYYDILNQ
jgi:glycosyltransferase involved in cell wall biosynthesis